MGSFMINQQIVLDNIYPMDCFKGFSLMEEKSVDYVFTSPPYNRKRNDKYVFYEDKVDWLNLLDMLVKSSFKVLKDDGYLFLNIQKNYYNKVDFFRFLGLYADYIVEQIIWGKNNPMPTSGYNISNAYEVILVLQPHKKSLKGNSTYTKNLFMTNVNSKNKYKDIHKAVMNIDIARLIFDDFITKNSIILDPFMGVGTTAITCLEKECSYIGFEINQEYVTVANNRIAEYHNNKN